MDEKYCKIYHPKKYLRACVKCKCDVTYLPMYLSLLVFLAFSGQWIIGLPDTLISSLLSLSTIPLSMVFDPKGSQIPHFQMAKRR